MLDGSVGPSVVVWVLLAWVVAVGLFMALLYASGERDQYDQTQA